MTSSPTPPPPASQLRGLPTDRSRFAARAKRFFARLLVLVAALALCAAALVAVSELNARTWKLEVRHGHLVVLKGRRLPVGFEPWVPVEPALAEAYGPLDLETQAAADVDGLTFPDRAELDRAFFSIIERLAAPRVGATADAELERGLALLRRAAQLSGLDELQRVRLRRLQAEMGFALAKLRLAGARAQIDEALSQLRVTAESDVKTASAAARVLAALEPKLRELSATLRDVVDGTMAVPALAASPHAAPPAAPPQGASTPADSTAPRPVDAGLGSVAPSAAPPSVEADGGALAPVGVSPS